MPPVPDVGELEVGCRGAAGGGSVDAFVAACQALSGLLHIYQPVDAIGAISPSDDTAEDIEGSGATGTAGSTMASGSIVASSFSTPSLSRALVRDTGASPDGNPPPPSDALAVGLDGPTEGTWVFVIEGDLSPTAVHTLASFDQSSPTDIDRRVNLYTSGATIYAQWPRGVNNDSAPTADIVANGGLVAVTRDSATNELKACIVAVGGTPTLGSNTRGTLDWDGAVLMVANSTAGAGVFKQYGICAAVAYSTVLSDADLQTLLDAVV